MYFRLHFTEETERYHVHVTSFFSSRIQARANSNMLHGHFYSEKNNKDILIDVTRIVQKKHWYFDTNFIMMGF